MNRNQDLKPYESPATERRLTQDKKRKHAVSQSIEVYHENKQLAEDLREVYDEQ